MSRETIRKPVTIKDMARTLSLSTCTVSKILNGNLSNVKYRPETIRRVKQLADKMGYKPHTVARSLVSGKTHTIGLCVADIGNPVFAAFSKHFENLASTLGYATFTCSIEEDPQIESRYVDMLLDRHIDVLVISPVAHSSIQSLRGKTQSQGCDLIIFDRASTNLGIPSVVVNNEESMRTLTERCLQIGHRRFGVITGNSADISLKLRLKGIKDALRNSRLTGRAMLKVAQGTQETTVESGMKAVNELLALKEPPTIIISLANLLSIGAIQGIRMHHLSIGKDVSFAGFDDFPCSNLLTPPITVLKQPTEKLAAACVEIACHEKRTIIQEKVFEAELCWRDSVVAPSR